MLLCVQKGNAPAHLCFYVWNQCLHLMDSYVCSGEVQLAISEITNAKFPYSSIGFQFPFGSNRQISAHKEERFDTLIGKKIPIRTTPNTFVIVGTL